MKFATIVTLLLLTSALLLFATAAEDETTLGPFATLQRSYESLSDKGKLAAGAAAGFVGTKLATGTVTKVVKVGAAAFIATEALKMTGALDDLPALSEEQSDMIKMAQTRVLRKAEEYRVQVRKGLKAESIQTFFEKEKATAFGVAGGAIAGAFL